MPNEIVITRKETEELLNINSLELKALEVHCLADADAPRPHFTRKQLDILTGKRKRDKHAPD